MRGSLGHTGKKRGPLSRTIATAALLLIGAIVTGCREKPPPAAAPDQERLLVGAYYYTWYPRNFGLGTLRRRLVPPQPPELGLYGSRDVAVAERHIDRAAAHGIDFFAVGWWPLRPKQNLALTKTFLEASNISDIRFCIFYETWNLGFTPDKGATVFDEETRRRFVEDLLELEERVFRHPSYLKIDGRPVVVFYLSRSLAGEYAKAVREARAALAERGVSPLFIADEVFWNALPQDAGRGGGWELTDEPQTRRMRLFDAVTAYNMYENARPSQAGYGADSTFLDETAERYRIFAEAAPPQVAFVPGVIPGYNDRGTRLVQDHYAIPRQLEAGAPEGSFLAEMWRRVALPRVDPRLPMVLITSWNEWNEDTAIEPLREAPPTTRDHSPSGKAHTQGYAYAGHGTTYLETVRDLACAVSGVVRSSMGGDPVGGVEVLLSSDGATLARDETDSRGRFCISRLHVPPGPAELAASQGSSQPVTIDAQACRLVDLVQGPPLEP